MKIFKSRIISWSEKVLAFVLLFTFSQAIFPLLRRVERGEVTAADGDPLLQAIWFFLYAITFFLILIRLKSFLSLPIDMPLILLVGLAGASYLWSAAPDIALRRSVALLGSTLFGFYLALRFSLRDLLIILVYLFGLLAILNLVFGVALPDLGVMEGRHEGAWRGVFLHKNLMGRTMALGAIVFLTRASSQPRKRFFSGVMFALCSVLVVVSDSRGAWAIFGSLLVLWPFFYALRWRTDTFVVISIVAIIAAGSLSVLVLSAPDAVTESVGRNVTLSGRVPLWRTTWSLISERPWLGYGYSSFWLGWHGASARVWRRHIWEPPHAHNGLLDLALDLGVVGLIVFLIGFFLTLVRSLILLRKSKDSILMWPVSFLAFLFITNLIESQVLQQNNLFWILYVTLSVSTLKRVSDVPGRRAMQQQLLSGRQYARDS